MTDERLEKLAAALKAAPADPRADLRDAHIAKAEEIFARRQETRGAARPTSDSPGWTGPLKGVFSMLNSITSRGALAATTGLVAAAIVAVVILPEGAFDTGRPVLTRGAPSERPATQGNPAPVADMAEPLAAPEPETFAGAATSPSATESRRAVGDGNSRLIANDGVALAPLAEEQRAPGRVAVQAEGDTEAYANAAPGMLKITAEEPVSTFSIDVDTASYGIVRSSLMNGMLPDPEAVRVEEMVNYFPYTYPAPGGDAPFRATVAVAPTPWNEGTRLLHIGIQGRPPATDTRAPLNLVFLIDSSGSMQDRNKLPLLKQSFRLMLSELQPEDEIAIVTYAGSAGKVLAPTPASDRAAILSALERLSAGGSTAGQAGLQQAYAVAAEMAGEGEVNRVILATDGDFNVGLSDPEELKSYIAGKRESGTYLSVLGFGRGNLDDATMQALAQNGNGMAAYIDSLSEAQKVLVDQLSGALFPIADDVKIQVEFNPAQVAEYRLIGYETRALRREDFNNDRIDAGEIGAGHAVTAIYEVTPTGSDAVMNDPLRYAEPPARTGDSAELAFLRLRYKAPGEDSSRLLETPVLPGAGDVNEDTRFAAAIAGFGQLLRGSDYLGDWGYEEAIALASGARGEDPFGYRSEAVTLMRLARSLAGK